MTEPTTPPGGQLPAIRVHEVTRDYRRPRTSLTRPGPVVPALRGVSLQVARGQRFGIVGESGCGKSTLLRIIAGLDQPTSGSVQVEGVEISRLPERRLGFLRSQLQLVFQDPMGSLDPRMQVADIVAEPLVAQGHRHNEARVRELLEAVGLQPEAAERYPHQFSGGQRQRISIARALAPDPRILVADEPVSALDVSVRAQVLNLIAELVERLSLTLVFVSHDLSVVRHVCDTVAVMSRGEIVEVGSTEQVYEAPIHPYSRQLVAAAPRLRAALAGRTAADLAAETLAARAEAKARRADPPVAPADSPAAPGHRYSEGPLMTVRPGPTNTLTDVAGIRVGHATRIGDGWLTGSTVVLAPEGGAVAGVDVRGGGPGTRETDLLDPRNLVERVHAVCLSGGSAFGLAAADGVMQRLYADGVGFPMGAPGEVVPIVPAAVVYDLGRGGDFGRRPDASFGSDAYVVACADPVPLGCVGAGTGARAGGLKGGIGSASAMLADGSTVAALVVVNAVGSCVDPATGELYAARFAMGDELGSPRRPSAAELAEAHRRAAAESAGAPLRYPLATTIGVIATDLALTKAQCAKVSGIGHDGLARAIRPVHTLFDGDTLFTLATGARPAAVDPFAFHALLDAAGDVVTRAVGRAMVSATSVTTPAGEIRCYREAFASAFE